MVWACRLTKLADRKGLREYLGLQACVVLLTVVGFCGLADLYRFADRCGLL